MLLSNECVRQHRRKLFPPRPIIFKNLVGTQEKALGFALQQIGFSAKACQKIFIDQEIGKSLQLEEPDQTSSNCFLSKLHARRRQQLAFMQIVSMKLSIVAVIV